MRYHTSSINRKAKPTTPAATGTRSPPRVSPSSVLVRSSSVSTSVLFSTGNRRAILRATKTTSRLSRAAIHTVLRMPRASRAKKVVSRVPRTAPRVFTA